MRRLLHFRLICIFITAVLGCGMVVCTCLFAPVTWGISGWNPYFGWKSQSKLPVSIYRWGGHLDRSEEEYDDKETILSFCRSTHAFSVLQDAIFANTGAMYLARDKESFTSRTNADSILNFDKISFYMDLLSIESILYSTEFGNHSSYYKKTNFPHKYLSIQLQGGASERLVYSKTASIIKEAYAGWWDLGRNWFYPDAPQYDETGPNCIVLPPRPSGDTLEGFFACLKLYFQENLDFRAFGVLVVLIIGVLASLMAAFDCSAEPEQRPCCKKVNHDADSSEPINKKEERK